MRIHLNVVQRPDFPVLREIWRRVDSSCLAGFGIPDSPAMTKELWVTATACALATERSRIITSVTNSVTRDPSVTAAAAWTLSKLSGGRLALGIGTGDSALWGTGLTPSRLSALAESIRCMKALMRGERATLDDRAWSFAAAADDPIDVPVYIAAAGPRTLATACEVADGAIVAMGFSDENIAYVREIVARELARHNRSPEEFRLIWNGYVYFGASPDSVAETTIGFHPGWLTMGSLEGKQIPDWVKPRLLELTADYKNIELTYRTPDRGAIVVRRAKELGIHEWLLDRSPRLMGTGRDVAARFRHFEAAGLEDWLIYVGGVESDPLEFVGAVVDEVAPHLRPD